MSKQTITDKQAKLTANILGLIITDDKDLEFNDNYNYIKGVPLEEWKYGLEIESIHGTNDLCIDVSYGDLLTTSRIALAHLKYENPDYYKRLKKMKEQSDNFWKDKQKPKIINQEKCSLSDRWGQYLKYKKETSSPIKSFYIWSWGGEPRINRSYVQSILFDNKKWTINKAKNWLKKHQYNIGKLDKTNKYLRFRQKIPRKFKEFRTQSFGKNTGIKAILGWEKPLPKLLKNN
jgi:hypothetical protein